jgi:hypothetical protein
MRWILTFLFVWLVSLVQGQYHYEAYTPSNGLTDARVNKIIQMKDGRLIF